MASFNPNECKPGILDFDTSVAYSWVRKFGFDCWKKTNEPEVVMKLPLRRFDPTLRKLTQLVIPTDLDRLRRHQANMEKHLHADAWHELNIEQINASRTVQQLRATVRDLENTRHQIQESDLDTFDQRISKVKNDVTDAIASFKTLEAELLGKMREMASPAVGSSARVQKRTANNHTLPTSDDAPRCSNDAPKGDDNRSLEQLQIQIQTSYSDENAAAAVASWNDLRQSLVDLNMVIREFSDIVAQQQEQVDTISENVEQAHSNVRQGVVQLAQANKYKAAVLPVAGAVVGGLVGGPIGLIAGFKLAGVATALGGSFVGWQGAKYLKRRRDDHIQIELNKLSGNDESKETSKFKKA